MNITRGKTTYPITIAEIAYQLVTISPESVFKENCATQLNLTSRKTVKTTYNSGNNTSVTKFFFASSTTSLFFP